MCEATTVLWVASLVLTAAAGAQQASAQRASVRAEEQQSAENAKAATTQMQNTQLTGQIEEDRRRQQTRQMLASQRVAMAGNNVDMTTGTPLEMLGDTAAIGEQDALTIRANAARQAWGYSVDANNSLNQGQVAKASGKNAATGTYLSTAASMTQQGYSYYGNRTPKAATAGGTTTGSGVYGFGAGVASGIRR